MSGGNYFYEGAKYGFDPEYGGVSNAYSTNPAAGIGLSTDARQANVLKEINSKLNTGATTIEVSQQFSEVFESIPKQHFAELNRLRKLVGKNVELTLHAPMIEPTGLTKRGWNPYEREQAERQMLAAVEKAHELNPEGNVVTTFHASIANLPAETRTWEEVTEGGEKKKKAIIKEAVVIDERTGEFGTVPGKVSKFESEKEFNLDKKIEDMNKSNWYKGLQHLNWTVQHGSAAVGEAMTSGKDGEDKKIVNLYKEYAEGKSDKIEKEFEKMDSIAPGTSEGFRKKLQTMQYGDLQLRDAYTNLKEMFDQAYFALEHSDSSKAKTAIKQMDDFRKKIAPKLNYLEKPEKVHELADEITHGMHLLRSVSAIEVPKVLKPIKEFALDKGSDTFSNLAFESYKKFKEHSPIISIENAPAGTAILYTGKELNDIIQKSRDKFAKKAVEKLGMSESEAENQAKKLIGATWDVGHINMLRKFGAGEKEILEETKAVAKNIKHIHLSDNFGMEHTELPMGMGNVPTKEMMKLIAQQNDKLGKVKKVVEAMHWYQHFQTSPLGETLEHFNSPIYAMKNASYWNPNAGYFAGFGMSPEVHHSIYGAGFSNLPVELGGQMSGRSRVSGNPME